MEKQQLVAERHFLPSANFEFCALWRRAVASQTKRWQIKRFDFLPNTTESKAINKVLYVRWKVHFPAIKITPHRHIISNWFFHHMDTRTQLLPLALQQFCACLHIQMECVCWMCVCHWAPHWHNFSREDDDRNRNAMQFRVVRLP